MKPTPKLGEQCEHGALKRQCRICELEAELEAAQALREQYEEATQKWKHLYDAAIRDYRAELKLNSEIMVRLEAAQRALEHIRKAALPDPYDEREISAAWLRSEIAVAIRQNAGEQAGQIDSTPPSNEGHAAGPVSPAPDRITALEARLRALERPGYVWVPDDHASEKVRKCAEQTIKEHGLSLVRALNFHNEATDGNGHSAINLIALCELFYKAMLAERSKP